MVKKNYRKNFVQVCAMAQAVIHQPLDCRNRICGEQSQGCKNVSKNLEAISNVYTSESCAPVFSGNGTGLSASTSTIVSVPFHHCLLVIHFKYHRLYTISVIDSVVK
jgi:hypothetical protein